MQNFKVQKYLGKGSYGGVVLATRTSDSRLYAIKQIAIKSMSQEDKLSQLTEIRILSSIFHPNVVSLYEAFAENGTLNMVIEYAKNGDLDKEIDKAVRSKQRFGEGRIWGVLLQVLVGLRELHNNGVLHRDIKGQNILCFDGGIVKLADFGVSKVLKKGQYANTGIGTPYYISPEIWQGKKYDEKSDVFSLGCLIYQMCQLEHPFSGRDMKELSRNCLKGQYRPVNTFYSADLRKVIGLMLNQDPSKRPSVGQLLHLQEVESRSSLCPTTMEEQILPGMHTQKTNFDQFYESELEGTIKADNNMQRAFAGMGNVEVHQAQYEKRQQMTDMAEFQQRRTKSDKVETSGGDLLRQLEEMELENTKLKEQQLVLQKQQQKQYQIQKQQQLQEQQQYQQLKQQQQQAKQIESQPKKQFKPSYNQDVANNQNNNPFRQQKPAVVQNYQKPEISNNQQQYSNYYSNYPAREETPSYEIMKPKPIPIIKRETENQNFNNYYNQNRNKYVQLNYQQMQEKIKEDSRQQLQQKLDKQKRETEQYARQIRQQSNRYESNSNTPSVNRRNQSDANNFFPMAPQQQYSRFW